MVLFPVHSAPSPPPSDKWSTSCSDSCKEHCHGAKLCPVCLGSSPPPCLCLDLTLLPLLALSLEESKVILGSTAGTNPKSILKASSLQLCSIWASGSLLLQPQADSSDPVSTYTSPFLWSGLNSDPLFTPVSLLPSTLSIYSIHPCFTLYSNPDSISFHCFLEPSSWFLGPPSCASFQLTGSL